jgi:hypothetical protein
METIAVQVLLFPFFPNKENGQKGKQHQMKRGRTIKVKLASNWIK